jgi:hypothetical protein
VVAFGDHTIKTRLLKEKTNDWIEKVLNERF